MVGRTGPDVPRKTDIPARRRQLFTIAAGAVHRGSPAGRPGGLALPRTGRQREQGRKGHQRSRAGKAARETEYMVREEFRSELAEVSRVLVTMADQVRAAMREATTALLRADQTTAEQVVVRDDEVDAGYQQVEEKVYALLARQAPVAGDLRTVVTALHLAGELERMGDLAEHVAKAALRRHPARVLPAPISGLFIDMSGVADRMAAKIAQLLAT